ncbi:galactokinase [Anaerobacillus alkalidiazotrophicus]|uniref:Galactokinase n=1 Tax=Anaerobacillus alkalidiazotrophicus TaxID=472963 RepID=A0A1S2MA34_9BACI|nr:galactokinase [Anaerobacillus alkalidiazotrophicus]OIJ21529.1 galactokinase [Anaerobacillus alkalidiazotrophicus]
MKEKLISQFEKVFGVGGELEAFFAPGRVNLIGEHTDYNGGHAFPCALSVGTYAIARKRTDKNIQLYSLNFEEIGIVSFNVEELVYVEEHDWANYPKGVMKIFKEFGLNIDSGVDVLLFGNIPNGAGLSSSASVELVTSVMLKELFDLDINIVDMVKLSQKAENEFIGVSCGIMDQFAIGMGKVDHAVLLDCQKLDYTYSPIKLDGASLVIANTNKRRGLLDSKYNERRSECERALNQLKEVVVIDSLGDLTVEKFEQLKVAITNEIDRKRAKHAVYENARTIEAVERLKNGNIQGFGELMNQSHISLRDDYEVTGFELDTLVEAAWSQNGVIGSRMTGAGFGGCTISIVEDEKVDEFIENVGKIYKEKTNLTADFYVVQIGDGARKI